jgi:hypothetical protein
MPQRETIDLADEEPNPPDRAFLPYRDAEEDVPEHRRRVHQAVGAAVISCGVVFACGYVWTISNLRFGPPGPTWYRFNWEFPGLCSAAALLLLCVWGYIAWRRGARAVSLGLLVGLAIGLLCEGACFMR